MESRQEQAGLDWVNPDWQGEGNKLFPSSMKHTHGLVLNAINLLFILLFQKCKFIKKYVNNNLAQLYQSSQPGWYGNQRYC